MHRRHPTNQSHASATYAITIAAVAAVLAVALIAASSASAGGGGACTLTGSSLTGTTGNDVMCGTSGADTMNGNSGNDEMRGAGGNDFLSGGEGDDWVRGEAGNDTLIGAPGVDSFAGESGNDRLLARDGQLDDLLNSHCGSGTDSFDMDLVDALNGFVLLGASCEKITVGAINEGPNVGISRRAPKIKDNGKVPVRLSCPAELTAPCAGALTLGRSQNSQGAPKTYSIDPGAKDKVSARLSRRDRRKLSRRGEITALSTSVEQGEFGDKTTVQTLELTARRKRQT